MSNWWESIGSQYASVRKAIVTPKLGARLLELNTGNRPLVTARLQQLTDTMKCGEWKFNGEPILISDAGRILSGQHRLIAGQKSGASFETLIVFGVPDHAWDCVDRGSMKGGGDLLAILGYASAKALSAAANIIMAWERGAVTGGDRPDRIAKWVESNKGVTTSLAWGSRCNEQAKDSCLPLVRQSSLTAAHFIAGKNGLSGLFEEFMGPVSTGVGCLPVSAELTTRNFFMKASKHQPVGPAGDESGSKRQTRGSNKRTLDSVECSLVLLWAFRQKLGGGQVKSLKVFYDKWPEFDD